jgi:glutathionylspermidine synthase
LINYWKYLKNYLNPGILHFTCLEETLEDLTNTECLRDCAIQAGIETKLVFMDDIGWDEDGKQFLELEDQPIENIFKLYPWEWLLAESFGKNIPNDSNRALWIRASMENDFIQQASDPPYFMGNFIQIVLICYLHILKKASSPNYVKKPILSREGANIDLVMKNMSLAKTDGQYGNEGFIYQELFTLPNYADHYPVIGSWVIGQGSSRHGHREADSLITDNKSRFVPHLIK